MYNSPHETESLARVLPGKLLTLDAQCRRDRGTSACFKDDRVCAQLFCFDAGSGYCVSYRPAAEGSRCGDGAVIILQMSLWTKIFKKVSFNIASEASYVYILSGQKLIKNAQKWFILASF